MDTMDDQSQGTSLTHPYTCLSCALAFENAQSQRDHYATDLHRYNSKRRVAGLPSVTAQIFNDKIADRTGVNAPVEVVQKFACKACSKAFATAATLATHERSKKHKEIVFKAACAIDVSDLATPSPDAPVAAPADDEDAAMAEGIALSIADPTPSSSSSPIAVDEPVAALPAHFESSGDPKLDLLVAKRLAVAPPLPPTSCLFCTHTAESAEENAVHMRHAHCFVVPEVEFLVDLEGLLKRLGEEVGTWNVCICCGKGYGGNINLDAEGQTDAEMRQKASKGVEAVRNHMQSKSHCKLPYETETQRLDLADFYDFRSSYPDYVSRKDRKAAKKAALAAAEGWEDAEGDDAEGGADEDGEDVEVVYESNSDDESDSDSDDELPESAITYGDSAYELVLPSGARIGHRAHRDIHKQNLAPYLGKNPFKPSAHSSPHTAYRPSPHSLALLSLVPALQKDKIHTRPIYESGLIPARGAGVGANGDVIKARNKGEAKEASKTVRQFKEVRVWNEMAYRRGLKGNSQKYVRLSLRSDAYHLRLTYLPLLSTATTCSRFVLKL
ncbi:pre-60S factor REI1, partial [Phenoliferia sp. Uapishka_3]